MRELRHRKEKVCCGEGRGEGKGFLVGCGVDGMGGYVFWRLLKKYSVFVLSFLGEIKVKLICAKTPLGRRH